MKERNTPCIRKGQRMRIRKLVANAIEWIEWMALDPAVHFLITHRWARMLVMVMVSIAASLITMMVLGVL